MDFSWEVDQDLHGSDHFPLFITYDKIHEEAHPRWVFKRADWSAFRLLCESEITEEIFEDAPDPIELFTQKLLSIASKTVPKSSTSFKCKKPWFTEECKKAIKNRRAALQRFSHHPTDKNLALLRQAQAATHRIIKSSKKESWRNYVSKLNARSLVKKTWDMVRKISGKYRGHQIHHLQQKNGDTATDKESIAETLADEFAYNSSTSHYTTKFQQHKVLAERKPLDFNSNNTEIYNIPFTFSELQLSLRMSHDTAVGPDEIPYQFLKHLPTESLLVLLGIFNSIWAEESFPPSWRNAITIPIPKPGKDISNPTSYRPIALTSCICKTMERMVNGRLVHFLESNDFITPEQSGFRAQRSTMDHLVSLETYIRDGFAHGDHVVSVFFDLEKAYDTTWKHGIMSDLYSMGVRGHMPIFIKNFLSDRLFKVRLGSIESDPHSQEMGVPQGSVLSVTLFSIKINSITSILGPEIHKCLYVDDYTISYRSRYMPSIERKLQRSLTSLAKWADQHGFKFSPTKTVCVHFCNRRGLHPDPVLYMGSNDIPVVDKTKFLGVIFDNKLNFKAHIDYLRVKCQKSMTLLKTVAKMNWGADREVLLRLYRSLIRSRLDYGAPVYGSARPSYLKKLAPIQNQGLRLSLGAFRTSPISSLHAEAFEQPPSVRREGLALQYAIKVSSDQKNPAFCSIFEAPYRQFYLSRPNFIRPLSLRLEESLSLVCPDKNIILPRSYDNTPYWCLRCPEMDLSLTEFNKKEANVLELRMKFYDLIERYPDYTQIYTDGSKGESGAACAATGSHMKLQFRLPDFASIYTAELTAIYESLNTLEGSPDDLALIITDSLSALEAIRFMNFKHPLVHKILDKYTMLSERDKDIVFMWCPSHIGIRGNEQADLQAKKALSFLPCDFRIPFTDFKGAIRKHCNSVWQRQWDESTPNKLHCIMPILKSQPKLGRMKRREEIVLARARIGHTYFTQGYLLRGEMQPVCIPCQAPLTVKHILLECIDFYQTRLRYFNVRSLKQLFEEVEPSTLLSFIKEIGLYYQF
jgi:ribonuclease HI